MRANKRTSEWKSKWLITYVLILGCSEPQCSVVVIGVTDKVVAQESWLIEFCHQRAEGVIFEKAKGKDREDVLWKLYQKIRTRPIAISRAHATL